jgi:hypothetical protein
VQTTVRTGRLPFAKYELERWGGRVEKHVYICHIAETCANRQLVPLNTARQIIQDRDYPASTVNARQFTACRHTLFSYLKVTRMSLGKTAQAHFWYQRERLL